MPHFHSLCFPNGMRGTKQNSKYVRLEQAITAAGLVSAVRALSYTDGKDKPLLHRGHMRGGFCGPDGASCLIYAR